MSATGIGETKWRGKFWARWGDALNDAGFAANQWTSKTDRDTILIGLIAACRHYGHFPTNSEIEMLRRSDQTIPAPNVIRNNMGNRSELVEAAKQFIGTKPEYADIAAILPKVLPSSRSTISSPKAAEGFVYLIKSGDFFKVGRSDELERRVKEIRIALPDAATLLHAIRTDDPPGIEAYWHRRFAAQRANGEWFKLSPDDVRTFMKRKFQ